MYTACYIVSFPVCDEDVLPTCKKQMKTCVLHLRKIVLLYNTVFVCLLVFYTCTSLAYTGKV